VIRTLRAWNIRIDEAFFSADSTRATCSARSAPDIFFDDQRTHIEAAAKHGAAGHVPHGVANDG
jgi:5'-nucleotidase